MHKSAFALYLYLILLTKGLAASDGYIYGIPQTLLLVLAAIVSVIVYKIYSYYRTLRINKSHSEILRKRSSVAPVKKELLQDDSKDITDEIYEHLDKKSVSVELKDENRLLNTTESLIEFLKLKSEKVQIKNEAFNINNVLNEVAGSLSSDFSDSGIELIFDIDKSVPKNIMGDPLYLGQILINLLKIVIENNPKGEIKLEISKVGSLLLKHDLQFKIISTGEGLTNEKFNLLTTPYYDENGEYIGLELFVANELITLMNGDMTLFPDSDGSTIFSINIPLSMADPTEKRKYRLPQKEYIGKKVLLVDNSYTSALAIKKMLSYFKYQVTALPVEKFEKKKLDLSEYDIVMLNEELFKFYINNHIKSTRKKKDLKVIAISNLFRANKVKIDDGVVDRVINKPFSQERIFEVIIKIYEQGGREASEKITLSKPKGGHLAYRGIFEEKKNISADNFMDFKNANLLIVEDNTINQKILMSVLAKSHINIIVASNGQEAVDLVTKSSNKFDCILMDINMPIMDGYMATSTIRSDERFVDLPIVALTALVLDSEVDKMFKHGVSGYLSKPLEIGRLYSAFEFFLDKNTKGTELPAANEQIKTKEIDAIDIRQGIAYANGNEALYKEVLSEFISAYGTTDTLLRDLVDDQKYDHIKMLCSDMRSLTKSIGAYRMHEVVDRMYKLFLYNNDHMIPKYAEEYGRELEKLKSSIKIYKERHF